VTGWDDFSLEEMLAAGERRLALMRVFNAREGFTAADDRLPEKFFQPLTGTGPTAGVALDRAEVAQATATYYDMAGLDQTTGAPTPERLAALGIEWANDQVPA
jgi:aldehyde:ferredoxin oxidoreductase